ncbi:MAG: 16S rRNA (cytidine(1402)-2'-O)-methyltransferase [Oscillospiraceae bacterium]|nr:16S rRNA (cytidine(1402)-2'-O)-methyltransferase [Oscillospiraceae bacterium]
MSGKLHLVATPIGNLGDISERTKQTLHEADFIAAEDTRVTRNLLQHLNIKKELISYHEHNRRSSGEKIIARIIAGETCALVTDAGTPGISDPGEDLARQCIDANIEVYAIPGPCAAVAALTISGLPAGRFAFEGFLSMAKKSRFEHLNALKDEERTMIFYEAPHKLTRTLADMLEVLGDRRISISRELTKMHEETMRTRLSTAIEHYAQTTPRGEYVLVIEGAPHSSKREEYDEAAMAEAVAATIANIKNGLSLKDAVKITAPERGIPKNALYSAVLKHDVTKTEDRESTSILRQSDN